ncbi:MAG: histidine--tRNA ligase [Candidatus Moraniibacteriota bacterium]|nr:MAG: histidine--tRNA ligase [Candidatus Moranbacteria bacterium]
MSSTESSLKESSKKKSAPEKKSVATKEQKEPLLLQTLRGMRDILPDEQPYWERIRRLLASACQEFGFQRIDTPIAEYANLFIRSIGTGTDVIDKEIYLFETRGGDKAALRPELTASIARAYIEHGMQSLPKPVKLFSTGPLFRYDRPQEGRYREHWQANFDIFGESDAILDAQVFQIAARILTQLGLKNIEFQVNSIGTLEGRKEYRKILVRYLESQRHKLCQNCKDRLLLNPLRVLDCKEDKCVQVTANAPQSADYLDADSREHFKLLLEYLDELELPYVVNPRLVRGLDYYTKTVFEIYSTSTERNGKKASLGGGGRYDGLIKSLGGEQTPAIGFALGMDRLVLEMIRLGGKPYRESRPKVFLAQLGDCAKKKSLRVFSDLQKNDILVAESFGRGNLKAQLRAANRVAAEITVIIGQKEALDGTAIVKDMVSGTQEMVRQDKLVGAIKKILKGNVQINHNGNGK